MPKYINHFTAKPDKDKFGVILANLGTPESPDSASVRKFLRQFLSDPRVVELPRLIWWLILNGVILVIRPGRSAAAYRTIWSEQGSPLMVNTLAQVDKLEEKLKEQGVTKAHVRCTMRYGEPSMKNVLNEFGSLGIDRIVIIPLYPQYSGSTVGSVFDDVGQCTSILRRVPSVRFMNGYANHDRFIDALEKSVREHWSVHGRADKLVMSFHGVPQSFCDNGDPYYDQCVSTAEALVDKLELTPSQWVMCFQSRVGNQQWLQPYADIALAELPRQGVSSIDIMCPGFSVDCLETLEEVNMGYRELFLEAGGESFRYIPCLNDHPEHINMLAQFVRESASDWIRT